MKQPALFIEFKNSLKNPWAEELVDLFIFRPIAFLFVKLLRLLPMTPNQISLLAMAAGIAGGFVFAAGDRSHFIFGAVCYGLANILDCCDGMIARLKKNGTMTGRIVDGCIDYIIGIAVYSGFAVGLARAVHSFGLHFDGNVWLLMFLAVISFAAHAVMSDKYRNAFLIQQRQTNGSSDNEFEKFKEELKRLETQRGHLFDKNLIRLYLRYMQIQSGIFQSSQKRVSLKLREPVSPTMVVLWNFIGPSTHVSFLILSACLYCPNLFFIYVLGIANLWMIFLLLIKR